MKVPGESLSGRSISGRRIGGGRLQEYARADASSADKMATWINHRVAIVSGMSWRAGLEGQPKATSRSIITEKPAMVVMVTRSMFAVTRWDSGISSSTTTKIIAPAAKQRA